MADIRERIINIAEERGGCFTTKQIEEAGISRVHLKKLVEDSTLQRIGRGYYMLKDALPDEYADLQRHSDLLVFSHTTALYLHGMSDRVPHTIDITVPTGTNISRIKKADPNIRFHYIRSELFAMGLTESLSPMGFPIQVYDRERCICDLIRSRKNTDIQLYTQAIKEYFKHDPDILKLLNYGKQFGIQDKIRTYMEVLT